MRHLFSFTAFVSICAISSCSEKSASKSNQEVSVSGEIFITTRGGDTIKISGADVIILLDQISNQYCNEYIFNDNLSYVREDWSFLNEITETYRKRLIDNPDYVDSVSFQQGSEKAAFVFYNSHDKLQKFFDAPYQEEYIKYEQVFFVDEKYKSKIENPLNALRHGPTSDLTEKIDLDQYTL